LTGAGNSAGKTKCRGHEVEKMEEQHALAAVAKTKTKQAGRQASAEQRVGGGWWKGKGPRGQQATISSSRRGRRGDEAAGRMESKTVGCCVVSFLPAIAREPTGKEDGAGGRCRCRCGGHHRPAGSGSASVPGAETEAESQARQNRRRVFREGGQEEGVHGFVIRIRSGRHVGPHPLLDRAILPSWSGFRPAVTHSPTAEDRLLGA